MTRKFVGGWAGLVGLMLARDVAALPATAPPGLLAPSVCLSPLVILVLALTPAETLVTALTQRLGLPADKTNEET